jgi:hypothetical protein
MCYFFVIYLPSPGYRTAQRVPAATHTALDSQEASGQSGPCGTMWDNMSSLSSCHVGTRHDGLKHQDTLQLLAGLCLSKPSLFPLKMPWALQCVGGTSKVFSDGVSRDLQALGSGFRVCFFCAGRTFLEVGCGPGLVAACLCRSMAAAAAADPMAAAGQLLLTDGDSQTLDNCITNLKMNGHHHVTFMGSWQEAVVELQQQQQQPSTHPQVSGDMSSSSVCPSQRSVKHCLPHSLVGPGPGGKLQWKGVTHA